MTLNQMQYFYEVANCGSFSRAAQNLYISQPNLTKYIANLEKELGMKLFDRDTRHVELTDDGRRLLQRTELLFNRFSRALNEVRIAGQFNATRIPVTIGISLDEQVPSEVIEAICTLNTDPSSQYFYVISQDSYIGLIHRLRENQYDMVVTSDKNIKKNPGISWLPIRSFSLNLAINKRDPRADLENLKPSDLGDTPVFFALPDGKNASQQALDSIYRNSGGTLNLVLKDSPRELLLNVEAGAGAAIVSSLVNQSNYPDVVFRRYEIDDPAKAQLVVWHTDSDKPGLQELVDAILACYPEVEVQTQE